MTKEELAAIGLATFGANWQSPMARALDISPRHMRRLAAGAPISEGIEQDIRRMLGGKDIPDPDWPRDAWIIGEAPPEEDTEARRAYVVHTKRPRFTARVVLVDDDGAPEQNEGPADTVTGITYTANGYVICEIAWIDPTPSAAEFHRLLGEAADAIASA